MNIEVLGIVPSNEFEGKTYNPEQLAAVIARYSRNKEGLEAVDKIAREAKNPNKIFNFLTFGHSSIAEISGMIPVVLDEISILEIYTIFQHMYVYSAMESSTRYINYENTSVLSTEEIGISNPDEIEQYNLFISYAIEAYKTAIESYTEKAKEEQFDETDEKKLKKLRKNYVLDRVRYYLPVTAKTSAVILSTPRQWSEVIKILKSFQLQVFSNLAIEIENNLKKVVPNLIRHTEPDFISKLTYSRILADESSLIMHDGVGITELDWSVSLNSNKKQLNNTLQEVVEDIFELNTKQKNTQRAGLKSTLKLIIDNYIDRNNNDKNFKDMLGIMTKYRNNRYDILDPYLDSVATQYSFHNISIGIARDCNRHRSGGRTFSFHMKGLKLPDNINNKMEINHNRFIKSYMKLMTMFATSNLHYFSMVLGTQCDLVRSNTLRKTIYACEIRTGAGTNFEYARIYKKLAEMIMDKYNVKVIIGGSEPEPI